MDNMINKQYVFMRIMSIYELLSIFVRFKFRINAI